MVVSIEQFKSTLEALGAQEVIERKLTDEENESLAETARQRSIRVKQGLDDDTHSVITCDVYSATMLYREADGYVHNERVARMVLPTTQRALAHSALSDVGVLPHEMYALDGDTAAGQQFYVSLDGSAAFAEDIVLPQYQEGISDDATGTSDT